MAPQKKVTKPKTVTTAPVNTKAAVKSSKTEDYMELEDDNSDVEVDLSDLDMDDEDFDDEDMEFDDDMKAELEAISKQLTSKVSKSLSKLSPREAFIEKRARVHPNAGVIVVSRLPYGFFEDQLKAFFSQFGVVRKLRLSRNPKTGKSRHYAFIEFDNKEVATIVADTMDGYMMFGRVLQCKYIPKEHLHPDTFRNHHRKFRVIPWGDKNIKNHNQERNEEQIEKIQKKLLAKEKKRRAALQAAGYDYDFAGFEGRTVDAPEPAAKKQKKVATKAEKPAVVTADVKTSKKQVKETTTTTTKSTKATEEPVKPVKPTTTTTTTTKKRALVAEDDEEEVVASSKPKKAIAKKEPVTKKSKVTAKK